MEKEAYKKLVDDHGYNGLQLVHMTYDEAKEFAGEYGMNAILYNLESMSMGMTRLCNTEKGFCYQDFGPYARGIDILLDNNKYDIYWIGGK